MLGHQAATLVCILLLALSPSVGRAAPGGAKHRLERGKSSESKAESPNKARPGDARKRTKAGHAADKPEGDGESQAAAGDAATPTATKAPGRKSKQKAKRGKEDRKQAGAKGRTGAKRASKKAPVCLAPLVHVTRKRGKDVEHRQLHLTFCDGTARPAAQDSVSVLARPRDAERPFLPEIRAYRSRPSTRGPKAKRRKDGYLTAGIRRVDAGLLERLQKIADRFPGRTLEIISGHRPDARRTSRHHHAKALDIRVAGVSKKKLRNFARTLPETGVGYYPNSYFVHVDVRESKGYWVDRSGPGEPADYGPWPPPKRELKRKKATIMRDAVATLQALGGPLAAPTRDEVAIDEEGLTRGEVRQIRDQARAALDLL